MKQIYKNSIGERVILKRCDSHLIINMVDQGNDEAEICIPTEYAIHIANCILDECM